MEETSSSVPSPIRATSNPERRPEQDESESAHGGPSSAQTSSSPTTDPNTRRINAFRLLSLVLLLSIATSASVLVYVSSAEAERREFRRDFDAQAQFMVQALQTKMPAKLGALATLADTITAHAAATNQNFPRVSVPDFAVLASHVRVQADAWTVQYSPVVTDQTRADWEAYTQAVHWSISSPIRPRRSLAGASRRPICSRFE